MKINPLVDIVQWTDIIYNYIESQVNEDEEKSPDYKMTFNLARKGFSKANFFVRWICNATDGSPVWESIMGSCTNCESGNSTVSIY